MKVFFRQKCSSSFTNTSYFLFCCHVVITYVVKIAQSLRKIIFVIDSVFFNINYLEHKGDKDVKHSSSNCL